MNWLIHPIDTLMKAGVKSWLVGVVNRALDKYNTNVTLARTIVAGCIRKIEAVTAYLKSLDAKLADGKITEAEADALVAEAGDLAAQLTAK